jgi:hypothetical protein
MTERIVAWACIGCGRLEAPQPCIGVCRDIKVELVASDDYDQAVARADAAIVQAQHMAGLLRALAWSTPRDGEWERSYRALQAQARELLDSLGSDRAGGQAAGSSHETSHHDSSTR